MRLFNKVAIVGVGLIGGSLALAIKKKRLARQIIGVARHKKTLLFACARGIIDKGSQDIHIIKGADLVILATPVGTILKLAPLISKIISPNCIVIDVGSTKQKIVSELDKIFPRFIGTHPLAGSQKRGVMNASFDMFKNSLCILTPTNNSQAITLQKIKIFWKQLGARVLILKPRVHDKILSLVSHLPHLVAYSLIKSVPNNYLRFSASGLKTTTRIALSDHELWADIFLSNKKNMLNAIKLLQNNLSSLNSAIQKKNRKLVIKILKQAQYKRETLE